MRRRLRPWVKVTLGVIGIAGLSAAASCANADLFASPVYAGADADNVQEETPQMENPEALNVRAEDLKHLLPAEEETMYIPNIVKEVITI